MNWLERARHEFSKMAQLRTVNNAKRNPTAAMAVPTPAPCEKFKRSIGSNGRTSPPHLLEIESVRDAFEERAAIMEFDGGLGREEAERQAWTLVSKHYCQH